MKHQLAFLKWNEEKGVDVEWAKGIGEARWPSTNQSFLIELLFLMGNSKKRWLLRPWRPSRIENEWNSWTMKAGGRANHEILFFFSWIGGLWPACRQWLRQEEKTKKKRMNEWVSPCRNGMECSLVWSFGELLARLWAVAGHGAPRKRANKDKQTKRNGKEWRQTKERVKWIGGGVSGSSMKLAELNGADQQPMNGTGLQALAR